jgi:hypothetical protein
MNFNSNEGGSAPAALMAYGVRLRSQVKDGLQDVKTLQYSNTEPVARVTRLATPRRRRSDAPRVTRLAAAGPAPLTTELVTRAASPASLRAPWAHTHHGTFQSRSVRGQLFALPSRAASPASLRAPWAGRLGATCGARQGCGAQLVGPDREGPTESDLWARQRGPDRERLGSTNRSSLR